MPPRGNHTTQQNKPPHQRFAPNGQGPRPHPPRNQYNGRPPANPQNMYNPQKFQSNKAPYNPNHRNTQTFQSNNMGRPPHRNYPVPQRGHPNQRPPPNNMARPKATTFPNPLQNKYKPQSVPPPFDPRRQGAKPMMHKQMSMGRDFVFGQTNRFREWTPKAESAVSKPASAARPADSQISLRGFKFLFLHIF